MSIRGGPLEDTAYDPFRRHDRYGTAGSTPQPVSEVLRLLLLTLFVVPLKILGALACLVSFYAFCRASVLIPAQQRGDAVAGAGKLACRLCLFCLGFLEVRWQRLASDTRRREEPVVIVSNHCSWIDILVHMSHFFPAFVARHGTKNMMLIGLISQKMGCLYVDREKKEGNSSTNGQGVGGVLKRRIQQAASGGGAGMRPMLLFPEVVQEARKKVNVLYGDRPLIKIELSTEGLVLVYRGRVSPSWESMQALQHIWLILCTPFHRVTAVELPVYMPSDAEREDPLVFAQNVRKYMMRHSSLKTSSSTLREKREFHALLDGKSAPVVKKAE